MLLDINREQPGGKEHLVADVTPGDVFCSGVGGGEEFEDTDGSVKPAVVLPRRAAWRPVVGAEYIWARTLPTPEEARKGCLVTLVRPLELRAEPQSATLSLRVDDEADVAINGHSVAVELVGFTQEQPHTLEVAPHLRQGHNELRVTVRNGAMDREGILPKHNPSGVAYRLDVTY